MKKHTAKLAAIALAVFMAPVMSACQPTPDEPAVAGKGDSKLEEKITQKAEGKYTADARWEETIDLSGMELPTPDIPDEASVVEQSQPAETPEDMPSETAPMDTAPAETPVANPEATEGETETPAVEEKPKAAGNKKLTLVFDADVLIPDTDKIPVVKVSDGGFSQEDADKIIAYFGKDKEMLGPKMQMSKTELNEILMEQKRILAAIKERGELDPTSSMGYTDDEGNEKTVEMYKVEIDGQTYHESPEFLEQNIRTIEKEIKEAPDTVEEQPAVTKFQTSKELYGIDGDDKSQTISLTLRDKDGSEGNLYISNSQYGRRKDASVYYYRATGRQMENLDDNYVPEGADPDSQPRNVNMTKDEASVMAQQFLDELGIEGLEVYTVNKGFNYDWTENGKEGWVVRFRRKVQGVPVTLEGHYGAEVKVDKTNAAELGYTQEDIDSMDGDVSMQLWSYERMSMSMDDKGIINMEWNGRFNEDEIENDNVALLPFGEVKEIIKKQMPLKVTEYGIGDSTTILSLEHRVHRVELGLMRTAVKDKPDEYRLVPVWDVFSSQRYVYDEAELRKELESYADEMKRSDPDYDLEKQLQNIMSDDGSQNNRGMEWSQLTINAIDGTVIDRQLGY